MSRRVLVVLVGLGVVGVGIVFGRDFFGTGPVTDPVPPPPPALVVAPSELNFGEVWETNVFNWSFRVQNQSQEPQRVEGVILSCSCLAITPDRFTLQPGESISLNVAVDLTATSRDSSEAAFLLSPIIKLPNGQRGPEIQWTLVGRARRLLTLDRLPSFGRVSVLDQPLSPISLNVNSAIPLSRGITSTVDRLDLQATTAPDPADPRRFTLTLSATKLLPLGKFTGTVTLAPEDIREPRLPKITIPIEGRIVPDVECLPAAVLGGGRKVGSSFEQSITLASLGQRPFKVLTTSTIGPGLSVKPVGDEFVIEQQCLAAGQQTGQVVFQVEAADGRYAIPVEITYVGIAD